MAQSNAAKRTQAFHRWTAHLAYQEKRRQLHARAVIILDMLHRVQCAQWSHLPLLATRHLLLEQMQALGSGDQRPRVRVTNTLGLICRRAGRHRSACKIRTHLTRTLFLTSASPSIVSAFATWSMITHNHRLQDDIRVTGWRLLFQVVRRRDLASRNAAWQRWKVRVVYISTKIMGMTRAETICRTIIRRVGLTSLVRPSITAEFLHCMSDGPQAVIMSNLQMLHVALRLQVRAVGFWKGRVVYLKRLDKDARVARGILHRQYERFFRRRFCQAWQVWRIVTDEARLQRNGLSRAQNIIARILRRAQKASRIARWQKWKRFVTDAQIRNQS